jgi:WD40 repeat protein
LEKKGSTSPYSLSPLSSESARLLAAPRKTQRTISSLPFRVLEAPFIQDDFYLNLVDWGQCNVMAVGLGQSVYLWNAANASVSRLCKLGHNNHVTSVLWLDPPPGSRVGGSGSGSSSTNTTFHSSPLSPRPPRPMEGFGSDVGVGVTGTEDSSLAPLQTNTHKSSEALSNFLAVGDNYGNVLLYDSTTLRKVHQWSGHRDRVGALAFNQDRGLLTSGSRDRQILLYDTRAPNVIFSTSSPSAPTTTATTKLSGHRQEVCGLKWAPQHTMSDQLASGGNDNRLFIWDARALREPVLSMTHHIAAVKAIAWSPHQRGLLASGGGTADRCIRFWNTITPPSAPTASSSTAAIFPSSGGLEGRTASTATIGTPLPLATIDGGSQVCNLAWSRNTNEIVSTHGFSQNQITIWSYPSMQQLASLTGHTTRVLYLAMSPDGQNIVTAAGDETLRFWNVFPPNKR